MRTLLVAQLVVALGACEHTASHPPSPYPCAVREEDGLSFAAEGYEHLADVCWSEHVEQREEVDRKACNLGGDVLVRQGACTIGNGRGAFTGVRYSVFRHNSGRVLK